MRTWLVSHHVGGCGLLPGLALALKVICALCRGRMHAEAGVGREKTKLKKIPKDILGFLWGRKALSLTLHSAEITMLRMLWEHFGHN